MIQAKVLFWSFLIRWMVHRMWRSMYRSAQYFRCCMRLRMQHRSSDYLQPGNQQIAAGYALYGPCTMLVLTIGNGTHGFTLDRDADEFVLTPLNIKNLLKILLNTPLMPAMSVYWEPPIKRYINECKAGTTNRREKDFNTRWVASMVADIHRILMRGGIYLYPKDNKDVTKPGRLRLMYEANPMAMLVEQAGGLASTGRTRILEIQPEKIHQRVPVIMGSCNEVFRWSAITMLMTREQMMCRLCLMTALFIDKPLGRKIYVQKVSSNCDNGVIRRRNHFSDEQFRVYLQTREHQSPSDRR